MVLHVFTSFLGGVLLCIPYGLYSGTSLGGTTWRTLEGYPSRVLSYPLANHALPTCNTPWCIAIQFHNQPTSLLQYNFLPLHTHVAIQSSIAIHFPLANTALQNYHVTIQCLYCDTVPMFKWAVAHSVPAPYFFFPHFPEHSNKFIKIYFILFSSIFTHYKNLRKQFFFTPFFFPISRVAFLATSTCSSLNTASIQLNNFMSSTLKFIKILFHYPINQINLLKFISFSFFFQFYTL